MPITYYPTFKNSSGNVGIATISPATKLDIYGPVSVRGTRVLTTGFDIFGGLTYDIYGNIRVLRSDSAQADGMYIGYGGSGGPLRFFSNSGTTEFMTIATTGNVGIGNTNPSYKLDVNGAINSATYVYAGIFYDNDNTAYYTNPSATSNLVGLTVANTITGSISGNAATVTNGVYTTGAQSISGAKTFNDASTFGSNVTLTGASQLFIGSYMSLQSSVSIMGMVGFNRKVSDGTIFNSSYAAYQLHNDTGTLNLQIYTSAGGFVGAHTFNSSGNITFIGSTTSSTDFRAPIFYDSNNTAYYCDPASTSNLNAVTLNSSGSGGYLTLPGSITVSNVSSAEMVIRGLSQLRFSNSTSWDWNAWAGLRYDNAATTIYLGGPAATGIFTQNATPPTVTVSFVGTNNVTSDSNFKAPIFYDSGDTTYYLDPANSGTSLLVAGKVGIGNISPSAKLHVSGASYTTASAANNNVRFEGGGGNGLGFGTIDATSTYASWIQSGYVLNFATATYTLLLNPLGGNVAVGSTSAATLLQIGTGTPTAATGGIQFGDDTSARVYRGGAGFVQISNGLQVGSYFYVATYVQTGSSQIYPANYSATLKLGVGNAANNAWIDGLTIAPSGIVTALSDFRAPIFYDSNDTNYYVDPAGTSRVNTLYVANVLADSASGNGRILLYGNLHIDAYGAYDIYCNYYSGKRFRTYKGAGTGAETFRADTDGIIYAFEQFRTPIVYDYNDTTYYTDPSSLSNILELKTNKTWYDSSATVWGGGINMGGNNPSIGFQSTASTWWYMLHHSSSAINFYRRSTSGSWNQDGIWDSAGNFIWQGSSVRGQVFYDQNNTAYYIDAASTSNLNNLTVAGTMTFGTLAYVTESRRSKNSSNVDIETITGLVSPSGPTFLEIRGFCPPTMYRTTGDRPAPYGLGFGNGSESGGIMPIGAGDNLQEIMLYGANSGPTTFTFKRQIWEAATYDPSYSNYYGSAVFSINTGTGAVTASTDIRSPIFYDSNDTNYYVDPASTSIMQYVRATNFYDGTGTYNVNLGSGNTEGRGLVAGYSGGSYGGIGYNVRHTTTGGSWIAPLTDTSTYLLFSNGIYFYYAAGGAAGRTLSYSTIGSLTSAGIFTVSGDVRAPIFYDSNDTNYYLNPAGGSVLNTLSMAGTITGALDATASFTGGVCTAASYNYVLNGANDTGNKLVIFVNGSTRTADGGVNALTIRNDGGTFVLGLGSYLTSILGSSVTINGNTALTSASTLTAGNLSGTIPSGVLGNSTLYVGTTAIALNRGSASQTLTGISIDGNAATASNATQFGGEANTNFMRGLAGGTEANINNYTDNGFRTVAYTGHGKGLLSFNVGSSIGTVQHEYFYNIPTNGWRVRNKTDNTTWSSWGNVVMTDTNQGALTGTVITTGNSSGLSPTFSNLYAAIFYDAADSTYYLDPANTTTSLKTRSSVIIANASAPQNLAMLNIGYNGSGETRAIDIYGGWGGGENKSISFTHGSTAADIVAQINGQHNGPASRLRFGKLYHGGNSSTYTMELISESTTSAYLTVAGSVRSPVFYDSVDIGYFVDPNGTSNLYYITMPYLGNGTPNLLVNNGGSENWSAIRVSGGNDQNGIGYSNTSHSAFGRNNFSFHVHSSDAVRFHSSGWDTLFEVAGSSGNAWLKGGLFDSGFTRLVNPGGAYYVTNTSSVTGAIKIRLPRWKVNTMMRMTVKIYQYNTGYCTTIECGGYDYQTADWYNVFAYQNGDLFGNITVRFGNDGTYDCIWIGETTDTWSYPQVFVTDFQAGYSNYSADWGTGWNVSYVTSFGTVSTSRVAYKTLNTNSTLTAGNLSGTIPSAVLGNSTVYIGTTAIALNRTSSSQTLTGISVDGNAATATNVTWTGITQSTRTNYDLTFQPPANGYAGFSFNTTGGVAGSGGYFLIRGTSDNDVYTAEGITLVADGGWLTLAQRTTASRGVRIMTGTSSSERLKITTAGDIQFVNGNSITYNGNIVLHAGNYSSYSAFSGTISGTAINIAGNGAGADPYGTIAVTEPAGASNYSYYGLTRQANIGAGFGLTGTNGALGLGANAFWFGTATSTAAGVMGGAYIAFNGSSLVAVGTADATQFRDRDNTAYYINPAGNSIVSSLTFDSNITIYKHNDRNLLIQGGGGSDAGLLGRGSSGQFAFQVYGAGDGQYGFLDGAWAGWDIRKVSGGSLFLNNNATYYLNPASTTNLNILNIVDGNLELYKSQTVDMSNTTTYSTSNYYPVTISIPTEGCIIQIQNNLNSNVPSWATHGSGFTLNLRWRTNGSGWGTTQVRRYIEQYFEQFTNQTICGGITQMGNSSTEVVWLRGGGQYYFKFSRNLSATAQSATYTINSQSVSPTSIAQNTIWNAYSGGWTLYNDTTYSTSNMYTPVLYDYNNSAYFVDPASTSNLVGLTVANTITGSISGNAATVTNGVYTNTGNTLTGVTYFKSDKGSTSTVGANNSYVLEAFSSDGGAAGMSFHRGGYYAINMGLDPDNVFRIGGWSASANRLQLDMSGNLTLAGVVDATQFRDSSNTAYYCDPASTSNLNAITAAGNITAAQYYTGGWFRNSGSGNGLYNEATGEHFYSDASDMWNVASSQNTQGIRLRTGGHNGTIRGYFYADSSNNVGLLNQDGNWRVRVVGGDYALFDGSSIRGQIFYDSNDTTYYTDPAGTSYLNYSIFNGLSSADYTRQFAPSGGYFYAGGAQTGAIKIRLPANSKTLFPMLSFTCHIYNYSTGTSRTFKIGGHFSTSSWYNTFAYCLSESGANLNVRWGYEGNYLVVWIGETSSGWSYPNVFITDFQNGYSSINNSWMVGWNVSLVTAFDTVTNGPTAAGFFWNQNNDGSGSGLDADLVDGLEVHTARNDNANKIVRTDSNGYIQAGWINTTSGDNGTTALDRIYASSDAYIRYYTPANFRTVLDVPTRGGSGASGTWGISISGNAASATSATSATTATEIVLTGLNNGTVSINNPRTAVYRNENGLGAALAYAPVLHAGGGDTMWQIQGTYGSTGNGTFYFRQGYQGVFGNWLTMLSSANYNSYSPTLTGTGASGSWGISITGSSASCTGNSATTTLATKATRANGDFYIDDNYGNTVVGNYSSTRLQGVFAMGNSYKLTADGTGVGTLYGLAWSHPNFGGVAANLASHGLLILENGVFKGAWGGGSLRTPGDVRGTLFYDWDNTAYYVDPASTSNLVGLTVANTITGSVSGNAGTVTDGVYASTTQTISGVKTFSSAPIATNIAKAWVHFNGTSAVGTACTVNASYNVTSVSHNATGDYTVSFVTGTMTDANYAVAGTTTIDYTSAQSLNQLVLAVPRQTGAQSAGSCRLVCEYIHGAQLYDAVAVRAVFFR